MRCSDSAKLSEDTRLCRALLACKLGVAAGKQAEPGASSSLQPGSVLRFARRSRWAQVCLLSARASPSCRALAALLEETSSPLHGLMRQQWGASHVCTHQACNLPTIIRALKLDNTDIICFPRGSAILTLVEVCTVGIYGDCPICGWDTTLSLRRIEEY